MRDASPAGGLGGLGGFASRLDKSPGLRVAMAIATIITVPIGVLGLRQRGDNGSPGPEPSPASSTLLAPATLSPSPARGGVAVGDCLDADRRAISCAAEHRYEVVSLNGSRCTSNDLIRYLGGHVDRDVPLVAPVVVRTADGAGVCVVSDPAGTSHTSARQALAQAGSGTWRRCLDERTGDDHVPCSALHTAEFVGVAGNAAADASTCRAAAELYLAVPLDRVSDRLAVAVIPASDVTDGQPRCMVRVLGNELLNDTLRNIGVRALPLVAPD